MVIDGPLIDNYSRKILAWTAAARLDPTATCQLLLAAGKHLVFAGRPLLYADSGVGNVNGAVEATLLSACLDRVQCQNKIVEKRRDSGRLEDVPGSLQRAGNGVKGSP